MQYFYAIAFQVVYSKFSTYSISKVSNYPDVNNLTAFTKQRTFSTDPNGSNVFALEFLKFIINDLAAFDTPCPLKTFDSFHFTQPFPIENYRDGLLSGENIYSSNFLDQTALRSFQNGQLAACQQSSSRLEVPPYVRTGIPMTEQQFHSLFDTKNEFFKFGYTLANESPWSITISIIFMRLHNQLARKVQRSNPRFNDQQVFQKAKKLTTAVYQKIAIYEFLPSFFNISLRPFKEKNSYEVKNNPPFFLETYRVIKKIFRTLIA